MTERKTNFDLLRIIACLMVILLHTAALKIYYYSHLEVEWKIMNIYDSLVRSAVPIFFMISGAFILGKQNFDFKKFFKKNILKIIIFYIFWSLFYMVDTLDIYTIIHSPLKAINIFIDSKYHLWFIRTLIGIYLIIPFIKSITKLDDKYIKYYLLLFLIFTVFKRTLIDLFPSKFILNRLFDLFDIPFFSYVGYYILGYYIMNKDTSKLKIRYIAPLFLITVIISSTITYFTYKDGSLTYPLYNNFSITTFIESILLFIIFKNIKIKNKKINKIIPKIASLTLGVYAMHIFILELLTIKIPKGGYLLTHYSLFMIPLLTFTIFIICSIITLIIKKIPILKKYIV